jgi:hypothetical protein
MKPPVVLTGPPGSGKTTASIVIAESLGYTTVNIGDELAKELCRIGHPVPANQRAAIGQWFLKLAGTERYLSLVERIVQEAQVVDGLRSAAALQLLRATYPELLHIHRLGRPELRNPFAKEPERHSQDNTYLDQLAQVRIEWLPSKEDLERLLHQQLVKLGML